MYDKRHLTEGGRNSKLAWRSGKPVLCGWKVNYFGRGSTKATSRYFSFPLNIVKDNIPSFGAKTRGLFPVFSGIRVNLYT